MFQVGTVHYDTKCQRHCIIAEYKPYKIKRGYYIVYRYYDTGEYRRMSEANAILRFEEITPYHFEAYNNVIWVNFKAKNRHSPKSA